MDGSMMVAFNFLTGKMKYIEILRPLSETSCFQTASPANQVFTPMSEDEKSIESVATNCPKGKSVPTPNWQKTI